VAYRLPLGRNRPATLAIARLEAIVNRLTRVFPIIASLLGAASFVACTDEATAPSVPQFAEVAVGVSNVTPCKQQLASRFTSAWIGPEGGVLKAGGNVFTVPAGALKSRVFITMKMAGDNSNHVIFFPEGLVFNKDHLPHLLMSYQDCLVTRGARPTVAYVNNALGTYEPTPSYVDAADQTVEGLLSHFSEYVLLSTYAVVY
jgi:hypothetical protein